MKASDAYKKAAEVVSGQTGNYRSVVNAAIEKAASLGRFSIQNILPYLGAESLSTNVRAVELKLLVRSLEEDGYKVVVYEATGQRDEDYVSVFWEEGK